MGQIGPYFGVYFGCVEGCRYAHVVADVCVHTTCSVQCVCTTCYTECVIHVCSTYDTVSMHVISLVG